MAYAGAGLTGDAMGAGGRRRIAATRAVPRLPGVRLPDAIRVTQDPKIDADIALIAVPTQSLGAMLTDVRAARADPCLLRQGHRHGHRPRPHGADPAPHARGAGRAADRPELRGGYRGGAAHGADAGLRRHRSRAPVAAGAVDPDLRLYRTTDVVGAELGGALKNVVAIAAGAAIGAGLGDSARAAIIARGFAEMGRVAGRGGARLKR
jgi:glycerol-3-phosphate dehydrogenase (NAD(P)+)